MSTSRAPLNGNASIAQRVQRYLLVDLEKNLVTICYISSRTYHLKCGWVNG